MTTRRIREYLGLERAWDTAVAPSLARYLFNKVSDPKRRLLGRLCPHVGCGGADPCAEDRHPCRVETKERHLLLLVSASPGFSSAVQQSLSSLTGFFCVFLPQPILLMHQRVGSRTHPPRVSRGLASRPLGPVRRVRRQSFVDDSLLLERVTAKRNNAKLRMFQFAGCAPIQPTFVPPVVDPLFLEPLQQASLMQHTHQERQ